MIDPGYAVRLVQRGVNAFFKHFPSLNQPHLPVNSREDADTKRDLRWAAWIMGLRDGDWTGYASQGQLPPAHHPIEWWPIGPHIVGYPLQEFCQYLQHPTGYWSRHPAALTRHRDRMAELHRALGGPSSPIVPGPGRFGVDYASDGEGHAHALAADGVQFACRYLSTYSPKNLHRSEAVDLARHGIDSVVVWETTADRALDGQAAGVADAQEARAQARACGMPDTRPIYFAVDFDAEGEGRESQLHGYFHGAASVLGNNRLGVYAGYGPVLYLMSQRVCAWGWQTYAWSYGRWHDAAQLRQYSNDHVLAGLSVDYDHAHHRDYGGWRP